MILVEIVREPKTAANLLVEKYAIPPPEEVSDFFTGDHFFGIRTIADDDMTAYHAHNSSANSVTFDGMDCLNSIVCPSPSRIRVLISCIVMQINF